MLKPLVLLLFFCLMNGCATLFADAKVTTCTSHCTPEDLAALPPGARVEIAENSSTEFTRITFGTVLKSGPEGVVLVNCDCRTSGYHATPILSKMPHINRLYKNTGMGTERFPALWIPSSNVMMAQVLEPAPADYVAPQVDIEMSYGQGVQQIGIDFDFAEGSVKVQKGQ